MVSTRILKRILTIMLMGLACVAQNAVAQNLETAAQQARSALERFLVAWNSGSIANVRQVLNYPHITHSPSGLIIAETPEQFAQDFTMLRRQGWASSSFDEVTMHQVSESKVNIGVEFSRRNNLGEIYQSGFVFYVFTKQGDTWGMQYRAGLPGQQQIDETLKNQARMEATAAIVGFFNAFNDTDHNALGRVNHVPQAVLNNSVFIHAEDALSPVVRPDFPQMEEREDWDHSVFRDLSVLSVSPERAIFELEFERINTSNEVYRRVPALWVLSKRAGKWGIEFRSLMSPTLNLIN